jgi:hypothetical protein
MSSIGNVVVNLIEKHSHNEVIDIMEMADSMGISVETVVMETSTDVAIMKQSEGDKRPKIELNKTNDIEQNYTLVALLLADCLIAPKKAQNDGFKYEIFFLKDLRQFRLTRTFLLATRLAIPEHIINQIDVFGFNIDAYIGKTNYLPSFVNNMVKNSNASFVVINNLLGGMSIDHLFKGKGK